MWNTPACVVPVLSVYIPIDTFKARVLSCSIFVCATPLLGESLQGFIITPCTCFVFVDCRAVCSPITYGHCCIISTRRLPSSARRLKAVPCLINDKTARSWTIAPAPLAAVFLLFLVLWSSSSSSMLVASRTTSEIVTAAEACSLFIQSSTSSSRSWRLEDCIDVWTAWSATIPFDTLPRLDDRDVLRDTASALKRLGTRCVVQTGASTDGAGSTAMRTISAWMFAEALGRVSRNEYRSSGGWCGSCPDSTPR